MDEVRLEDVERKSSYREGCFATDSLVIRSVLAKDDPRRVVWYGQQVFPH